MRAAALMPWACARSVHELDAVSNTARSPAGAAGIARVLEVSGHVSNTGEAPSELQGCRDAAYLLGKIVASLYGLPL